MKKKLVVACLIIIFIVGAAFCEVEFGIKGGITASTYGGTDYENFLEAYNSERGHKLGFTGGFFLIFNASDLVAFQPEILFSSMGQKLSAIADDNDVLYDKINYIEIPLLLKLKLGSDVFSIFGGGDILINIGDGERYAQYDGVEYSSSDIPSDIINKPLLGFAFGGDLRLDVIILDFRYIIGMSNIFDGSDNKQNAFELTLGILF